MIDRHRDSRGIERHRRQIEADASEASTAFKAAVTEMHEAVAGPDPELQRIWSRFCQASTHLFGVWEKAFEARTWR